MSWPFIASSKHEPDSEIVLDGGERSVLARLFDTASTIRDQILWTFPGMHRDAPRRNVLIAVLYVLLVSVVGGAAVRCFDVVSVIVKVRS